MSLEVLVHGQSIAGLVLRQNMMTAGWIYRTQLKYLIPSRKQKESE